MTRHLATDKSDSTVDLIRRYYRGCNSGDVELMASTFTPDVVHYFLQPGTAPVVGAEHLARYWRKVRRILQARWEVDFAIATGEDAAIEWTIYWTNPDTGMLVTTRGCEFYRMRDGRISEVRAYYNQQRDADCGLVGFDYAAREYSSRTSR